MTSAGRPLRSVPARSGPRDAVDRIIAAVSTDPGSPAPGPTGLAPGELVGRLRAIAMDLDLAAVLEHRAERIGNPALAAVLRERATGRRERAARVRDDLAGRGVLVEHAARAGARAA
jgi:hypothetical protein